MAADRAVVVVGSGQGGFQTAVSLRDHGFVGDVTVVGDEPGLPYQRPPLSKAFLKDPTADAQGLHLRPADFFADKRITLVAEDGATAIDRRGQRVILSSGRELPYDDLVLATGARPRRLPLPGVDLGGVLALRTGEHAEDLRRRLVPGARVVVIGGGFIGMEVAAIAVSSGCHVVVVESLDRILARGLAPETASVVAATHVRNGTTIILGRSVVALNGSEGHVESVVLTGGDLLPADVVVVGVGVVPNDDLARSAGLAVEDGVLVDDELLTDDPHISAIGDCARYPHPLGGARTRLESVQNAVDHARHVAARLNGAPAGPYVTVPWFWTRQFDLNIQIAGLAGENDERVVTGDPAGRRFSVLRFRGSRLTAVESVNHPADHMAARRLLAGDLLPSPSEVAVPDFVLKSFV